MPAGAVAWTRDGELVVLDSVTGDERRRLANVPVGVGVGPSSVEVTPDGRTAIVSWGVGEPGCFFRVGAVPIDGSGPLVEWGPGTAPAISPDGQRVAWHDASDGDCLNHDVVIRDLRTGEQQRISISTDSAVFLAGAGPFWQDNQTVVYREPDLAKPGFAKIGLAFDTSTATRRADGTPIDLSCLGDVFTGTLPTQVPGAGQVIVLIQAADSNTAIDTCRLDGSGPIPLYIATGGLLAAHADPSGSRVLLVSQDGSLTRIDNTGSAQPVALGPFQSAAW